MIIKAQNLSLIFDWPGRESNPDLPITKVNKFLLQRHCCRKTIVNQVSGKGQVKPALKSPIQAQDTDGLAGKSRKN